MPKKRQDDIPTPSLPIWKKDGEFWRVERDDLLKAIQMSRNSEAEIKDRMGRGYSRIEEALDGKALTIWNVQHIEWGLMKFSK